MGGKIGDLEAEKHVRYIVSVEKVCLLTAEFPPYIDSATFVEFWVILLLRGGTILNQW